MSKLHEMIKIAEIHVSRIEFVLAELKDFFPADEMKIRNLNNLELLLIEMFVSRFAKLQDLIGAKIIDAFFKSKEETVDSLTMIDKLNKLERLGILESVDLWREIRGVRNHLSHEYPDHPEITANYLNQMAGLAGKLILILKTIQQNSL